MSLYENEAENDNAVDADNFENEMDSPQSSESRNDMAHYEGSNENLGYNLLSDIQQYLEQERQSSAALKEEAQALKEQITNKEDVLKELEKNNSDLLSNYLEMKKKEEELAG
uniref:Uncharacterized protein n=1 Tax=Magallana gigas TaxID=29159 RepID=K1Q197_MAGGI